MREYGIGRVPADVDPTEEALAALDALDLRRQLPPADVLSTCTANVATEPGAYTRCGQPCDPAAIAARVMGCRSLCREHLDASIRRRYGHSLDEEIAALGASRRTLQHCRRCGQSGYPGQYPFSTIAGGDICDDCL